jgi:peptidyl-prolyl cis-trans isomerase SurA
MPQTIFNFFLISILIFFTTISNSEESKYELLDKIIAVVEKDVVTKSELNKELLKFEEISEKKYNQIINKLIEKKLIYQYAEKKNLAPTERDLQFVINNILNRNNISLEKLEEQLKKEGSSLLDLKNDIKYEIARNKIIEQEIMPYTNISRFEIDAFLEKQSTNQNISYKVSHILIKNSNDANEKIKFIYEKLKQENFSDVASNYSDGPFAKEGGSMGWNTLDELPIIFQAELKNMHTGDISKPIKSDNGFHILKLEDIEGITSQNKIFVKQYKFNQILLKKNSISTNEDLEQKIKNIKSLIVDGLNFKEAIIKYSDQTALIDIDNLEWVNENSLPPTFREQLSYYHDKEIIGPLETEIGWHLIKVYDFRDADITDEINREDAKVEIAKKKSEIRFSDWLSSLKENSNIKIYENNI